MVQWLGLYTFTAQSAGSIPGWRTKVLSCKARSVTPKKVLFVTASFQIWVVETVSGDWFWWCVWVLEWEKWRVWLIKRLCRTASSQESLHFLILRTNEGSEELVGLEFSNEGSDHGASLVVQLVKNLPAIWESQVWSLGREDTLEKGMGTYSSIFA